MLSFGGSSDLSFGGRSACFGELFLGWSNINLELGRLDGGISAGKKQ
jgi:hypothetical protein